MTMMFRHSLRCSRSQMTILMSFIGVPLTWRPNPPVKGGFGSTPCAQRHPGMNTGSA